MATQFDAVARLSVDIKGFAQAARQMTSQGGQMSKVFKDLHAVLNQVEIVEKGLAADLKRTLSVYSSMATAVTKTAAALKSLGTNTQTSQQGISNMSKALTVLAASLAKITGVSEKEFQRLTRTLTLYNQMASAIAKVNQATATAASAVQKQRAADDAAAASRVKAATAQQNLATATAKAELAQSRLNVQLERERTAASQAATAQNQLSSAFSSTSRTSTALRADLSEIEQLYRNLVKNISAAATASVSAAISHEASFAQVLRVTQETGKGAALMREEFEKLTTKLPVSFEELAKIGQLAAQTGVANEQLVKFADTVVRFSVTTGIASDQVTVLFARIADMLNLPTNEMDKFASTILKLGTISAATEEEILKVTQSIASSSRAFGLSTEEVAGLSGALASLRIPPEWSRGSATRIFRDLDNAANKAGAGMNVLTEVIGMNADEIRKLRQTDPGTFFLKFVEGMQKYTREGQLAAGTTRTITDVLSDLDINAVRDIDFITRLANNFSTLKTQTNEAFLEFARGTELMNQTEIVFGTAKQNIDNLGDAFQTFIAGVGEPFAKVLGSLAESLTFAIEGFRTLNPWAKGFFGVLAIGIPILAAVAAAIALYQVLLIKSVRGILAFNQVQREMNGQALTGRNVWRLYREEQQNTRNAVAQTAAAQQAAARTTAQTATGMGSVATNTTAATRAFTGYNTQLSNSAQQYSRVVPATTAATFAMQAQQQVQNRATQQAASYAQAWANTERVMPAATRAIREGNATMQQQANVQRTVALQQQAITGNTAQMTGAMYNLGAAQRAAATSSGATAAGMNSVGAAAVATNVAVRGASVALGIFKIALASIGIGLVITALTTLFLMLTKTKNASNEAAKAGFDAAGGQTAFGDAIRKDQAAISNGAAAIGRITAAQKDLSESDRARIQSRLEAARQEKTFIQALGGSIEALREQAKGTSASAAQAQGYVKRYEAADDVIKKMTESLKGNTFEISQNTQTLGEFSIQQAVMSDGASKNLKALEKLRDFGPQLQTALKKMFTDPTAAAKILQDEIEKTEARIKEIEKTTTEQAGRNPTKRIRSGVEKEELKTLEAYDSLLKTIKKNANLNEEALRGAALANQAFGKTAEGAAAGADAMANGMDDTAEAADTAASAADELADRIEALTATFSGLGDFSTAMSAAMDKAKSNAEAGAEAQNKASASAEKMRDAQDKLASSLEKAGGDSKKTKQAYDDYNRSLKDIQVEADKTKVANDEVRASFAAVMQELENVAQARMDRAQNLVRLAGRVPKDVLAELEKLGPEFSSFIQELTAKSDADLAKLIPTFRGAGTNSATAYGAGLAELLPLMSGRGKEFGDKVAAGLRQSIDEAVKGNGDIAGAIRRIKDAITVSDKLNIPLSVAIDLGKAQGEISKVEAILNEAVASGKLTKEAVIKLKSDLFTQTLAELQAKIKGTSLDTEGKATLNPEQYDRDRQRLIEEGTATTLKNLIGMEGLAELDPERYKQALDALKKLGIDTTNSNALGPTGKPQIDPRDYEYGLGVLTEKGRQWQREQNKWLTPVPSINQSQYRTDLQTMSNSSYNTGRTIQANLTRTATVSIRYQETNSPPQRAFAADGGWVRGAGGPRADKVPMMLSNGEFVVNAAAAKRYSSLLEQLNGFGQRGSSLGGIDSSMMKMGDSRSDLSSSTVRGDFFRRLSAQRAATAAANGSTGPSTVVTVNNTYPREEPTSVTVNRALAFAATLGGV